MILHHTILDTPLGKMLVAASSEGICLLEFSDDKNFSKNLHFLARELSAELLEGANAYIESLKEELGEYFEGLRTQFNVPLELVGSPFRKLVWQSLKEIPHGKTISYRDQALRLGNPAAVRAVAAANAANRILVVVPCHRVKGSNGDLTGYAGGLWRKKWLLDFEMNRLQEPTLFDSTIAGFQRSGD